MQVIKPSEIYYLFTFYHLYTLIYVPFSIYLYICLIRILIFNFMFRVICAIWLHQITFLTSIRYGLISSNQECIRKTIMIMIWDLGIPPFCPLTTHSKSQKINKKTVKIIDYEIWRNWIFVIKARVWLNRMRMWDRDRVTLLMWYGIARYFLET